MYETFLKTQPYRGRLKRSVTNTALWVSQEVGKFLTSYVTISYSRR